MQLKCLNFHKIRSKSPSCVVSENVSINWTLNFVAYLKCHFLHTRFVTVENFLRKPTL